MAGLHVHDHALFVPELEDLAGMLEQLAHQLGHAAIVHVAHLALPRFAGEIEMQDVPSHLEVLRAQGGDAVAAVLARIDFAARPQVTTRENAHDSRHHPLARNAGKTEVAMHDLSDARQRAQEAHHALELLALPDHDLLLVIEVLPAARRVLPHRLHGAAGRRVDGDVLPGGRDLERFDARPLARRDRSAIGRLVLEAAFGGAVSPDAARLQSLDDGHGHSAQPLTISPPLGCNTWPLM